MTGGRTVADLVGRLERAAADHEAAVEAVAAVGETRVEEVADALETAEGLLARYESRATGTGDFQAYVEFRGRFAEFVEDLPDDLVERAAFEEADELLDKRRLSESDFAAAREALGPARQVAGTLDDRASARDDLRDARRAVVAARDDREERIAAQERLLELGEADLEADVSVLREPMAAYDEAVRSAFASFKRTASARDVLGFVADAAAYPLVGFPAPPGDLLDYVTDHDAGTEPVSTLLSYADYSRSKLSHYVDDVSALKRVVGSNRTYLQRLDADPLTVGWPPPSAGDLRWRARELVAVVDRFAADDVLARLNEVRELARDDRYDRLRAAAVARDELTAEDRRRLLAGEVEDELERLRTERDRLAAALESYDAG